MQRVIGEFHSYAQARQAVHRLEQHRSIQEVVITGRDRGRMPRSGADSAPDDPGEFLVRMSGSEDELVEARALLAKDSGPPRAKAGTR